MNKKQKIILWIGIIIIVLMGLFPPYERAIILPSFGPDDPSVRISYGFLFEPPILDVKIDFARLAIQWIIVSVLTAGAIYTTKDQKDKK